MKKIFIIFLFLVAFNSMKAKYYAGFGANYHLIQEPNDLLNENFPSLNLHIENRSKCKLWYGLGLNLADIGNNPDAPPDSPFFNYIVQFEPSVRYNFISNSTVNYSFVPYIKTSLLFGFVDAEDRFSDISIGGTLSAGLSYGFNAFDECFMIDLNGGYSGFNTIQRADERIFLESLFIGLNMSVKL